MTEPTTATALGAPPPDAATAVPRHAPPAATESWFAQDGRDQPLGATFLPREQAFNFALFSRHATRVSLLLFRDGDYHQPALRRDLTHPPHKTGDIWHCRISRDEVADARYYAFQVDGPPAGKKPTEWRQFDGEKILFDPYAQALHFPPGFDREAAKRPGCNIGQAPLGILPDPDAPSFDWGEDHRPRHERDLVIYEMHVKGLTRHPDSGVDPERAGTYLGVIDAIPHLKSLGVTAVELMPVYQFDPSEGNYWGYNPLSFFAPHAQYGTGHSPTAHLDEFRQMVRALHEADIEVILDVVYNHTGELGPGGPVYCYKGIDVGSYYLHSGNAQKPYLDLTGTGNTVRAGHRFVRRLIVDSLVHWVREFHVDGFRFDLAGFFARNGDGALNLDDPAIINDIFSHPDLQDIRLIKEPWDAAGTYVLGRHGPTKLGYDWNDQFRDDVRRFVRGDGGMVGSIMTRIYGSDDLFPDRLDYAARPYQSVNYVTAHDGFTLYDLVSFKKKRNWANGEDNRDGTDFNLSWNCGHEGDEHVPSDVMALRVRQCKNFFCLLFLANGTPLIRAGDEVLDTQYGNNNPYNQDSELSWLDWSRRQTFGEVYEFVRRWIAFRAACPTICRSRFWRSDIQWFGHTSEIDFSRHGHTLAYALSGASVGGPDLYVMVNCGQEDRRFELCVGQWERWGRLVSTAEAAPHDFCLPEQAPPLSDDMLHIPAHSISVLIAPPS